jgi:hypothetical protein
MTSEPIEAALFTRPPALTLEQEGEYRTLDREGPLILNEDSTTTVGVAARRASLHLTRTGTGTGTLHRVSTRGTTQFAAKAEKAGTQVTVGQLAEIHTKEGYKIVSFTPGTGEDPREWSNGKKWCVDASLTLPSKADPWTGS